MRFKHTVLLSKDFHLCNAISFLGIVASDSENVIKTGKNVIKTDKNVITTDRNFIKNVKNTIKTGKIVVNVLQNNCQKWTLHHRHFKTLLGEGGTYENYEILPTLLSSLSFNSFLNHYPHLHPHNFWPGSCLAKKSRKTLPTFKWSLRICVQWYSMIVLRTLDFSFLQSTNFFSVFFVKAEDNF